MTFKDFEDKQTLERFENTCHLGSAANMLKEAWNLIGKPGLAIEKDVCQMLHFVITLKFKLGYHKL